MKRHRAIGIAGHELANARVVSVHQLFRRALPQHLTIAYYIKVVGDARGFSQVVGHHDTGDAERIVEQADQPHQHAHGDGILTDERLVIHEDLRIESNGTRQSDTALHAAGQFIRHQVNGAAKANGLQFQQHDVTNHFIGQLGMHPQRKRHVFENIEVGEQGAALEQHAHMLAGVEPIAARQRRQVLAVDPHFAGARAQLHAHQAQQGGLAATGRPHDARDFTAGNANIDVIEDAARPALEGKALQLDRVGVIGTHLNSLGCSLSLRHLVFDKCLRRRDTKAVRTELAANYITAGTAPPRPEQSLFRNRTAKKTLLRFNLNHRPNEQSLTNLREGIDHYRYNRRLFVRLYDFRHEPIQRPYSIRTTHHPPRA